MLHGFLVIDKPRGISSRHAVDRVQKALPKGTRIGHTGTLDPLASGVLVLALNQATRLTEYVQQQTKEYRAGVRFGATSATDDAEGPIAVASDAVLPSREQLDAALARFVGTIEQTPPAFSAAHVDGQRAYRIARKGKSVDLKPKPVRIDRIELLSYAPPAAELSVVCGKGTYIRSLARDLGGELGCGAYLTSLQRTRVGAFHLDDALPCDATADALLQRLRPLGEAMTAVRRLTLTDDEIRRLAMGQTVATAETGEDQIAIFNPAGEFQALATIENGRLRPMKVFVEREP